MWNLYRMKVILELKKGKAKAKRVIVRQDIVIGRSSECHLRLPSYQVSRKHCSLTFQDDVVYATDLGSSNGTRLNGVKLPANQPFEVGPKMKLTLGPINFVIYVLKEDASENESPTENVSPEITELPASSPVAAVVDDLADSDLADSDLADNNQADSDQTDGNQAVNNQAVSSEANLVSDPLDDVPTSQGDSLDRVIPSSGEDKAVDAQNASESDGDILQFDESMLSVGDSPFELPAVDLIDSEEDIDEVQVIADFVDAEDDDVEIVEDTEKLDE